MIERGGVVRLAEPPPGPSAAPQLIVPPAFEPPSHATTMREFAITDDPHPPSDGPGSGPFYVARQPPVDPRDFNALLGADVRAYVDDDREAAHQAAAPTFNGPANFGSDAATEAQEPPPPAMPTPEVLPDFAPAELVAQASGPELTMPEQTFVPAEASHTPINVPIEVPQAPVEMQRPPEPTPPLEAPKRASGESRYEPPERPPALMFPSAHVAAMSGPAREAEQTQLAPVVRSEPVAVQAPEPVLLTSPAPAPEVLSLPAEMPEWSGGHLEEAAAYVPPFSAPVRDDEIDSALVAEQSGGGGAPQRRVGAPTPDSYFDASDPLATAEADMYAGHQVVAPTEHVGDAFTAMVPPIGTPIPEDAATVDLRSEAEAARAELEAEDLAALRGGRRRGMWMAAACLVLAVGGASYAASRGYLDPLIAKVKERVGKGQAPVAEAPTATADAPKADAPKADGPKADAPIADVPKADAPKAEAPKADVPIAEGPKADEPKPETAVAPAAGAETEATTKAGLATPSGPPSKALMTCYTRGNRYLNAKKVNLAIRELNKCLDIDPTYGRTYRSLGVAYMQLGRERSAILAYEKFVDYEPQHKDVAKVREIIADYYRRRKN